MTTQFKVVDLYRDEKRQLVSHETEMPTAEARFAMDLVVRHGLVMANDAGEDTAGRAKVERTPPAEVVEVAVETAKRLFERFRQEGWLVPTPSLDEVFGKND